MKRVEKYIMDRETLRAVMRIIMTIIPFIHQGEQQ